MRISVPGIPPSILAARAALPPGRTVPTAEAVDRISTFIAPGNVAVLTGAGVSVDSGIRAYRGKDGRYMNPNYKPILYHELIDESPRGYAFRQRYWLRSYLGYPPVRDAQPNPTHYALAALQHTSLVPRLITQNVDGLHRRALSPVSTETQMDERILELHGTLHKVRCKHGHAVDRDTFQSQLSVANPQWAAFASNLERTGRQPRTNPDGDVVLEGVAYDEFVVPECTDCLLEDKRNSNLKPEVIFFGESISQTVKDRSFYDVETSDRLFVLGTTLATYSAYRLLKYALSLHKPVLLLNLGPTRADDLPGVEKIEVPAGEVMRDVVRAVLGAKATEDLGIRKMLASGIVKPPVEDDDDRAPRAAG